MQGSDSAVMERKPWVAEATNDARLEIKNLNVYFGDGPDRFQAVKNVSLKVQQGGSFGIVGESGSGKSTVLRAVCGLVESWMVRSILMEPLSLTSVTRPLRVRFRWCFRILTHPFIHAIQLTEFCQNR